jgi:hypothetical protein
VRGGRLLFARARWGRCRRGEELSYFIERDGGGVGEGRSFHIFSSEMGDVSARGGASTFARARWGMCRSGEGVYYLLEQDGDVMARGGASTFA